MSRGLLIKYFSGLCAKKLSAVEADFERSNQHEFNGTSALRNLLGSTEPKTFSCRFLYMQDDEKPLEANGELTWYDARRAHPTRSEYRLYYPTNAVSLAADEGDTLILVRQTNGNFLSIIAKSGSTIERQLIWLFDLPDQLQGQFHFEETDSEKHNDFAIRYILEELGFEIEQQDSELDQLLEKFGNSFPSTREFSMFARSFTPALAAFTSLDLAIMSWMEKEESLFRQLEKHIVAERLRTGFVENDSVDVEGFVEFSLSVHNRRKARAGYAFENHLEQIFRETGIAYSRGAITERREKPDFIFPGIEKYRSADFPENRLTMLGVKSTCKDRWRQVLTEAERIKEKHLITLEPGISESQTAQMQANCLQLIIPDPLQETYLPAQRQWLFSLEDFVSLLKDRA